MAVRTTLFACDACTNLVEQWNYLFEKWQIPKNSLSDYRVHIKAL